MNIVSWNVNGLRAITGKNFYDFINEFNPDILCLQETKIQEGQIDLNLSEYEQYFCYADKKGYSGTAILSKVKPLNVSYGIGIDEHDHEGRVITAEYENFYLVCAYIPNSQTELKRLDYRRVFNSAIEEYLVNLDKTKPVLFCGDLNVAHKEIDIKNPKTNLRNAGFTIEERDDFTRLLSRGFTDSFRALYPDEVKYSWWSYKFKAREKNTGWRIDYFVVSNRFMSEIKDAYILNEVMGSDHCPVGITI
ncbi:exodeoxyribonuclease III [Bullifex porci]|uniref:exodeoxyribonuclease III n=1 Tax=Bullifex porci TaxID=2606638 RepID=UPI0023F5435D|nr:exodeoxyribonuclease III [Bullifex porci]MDD7254696.1 exodeoxyribonuclease III [Bullifex porci]MDY2740352.1 exodeoxyribonuclease III [Bullifex porci]